MAYLGNAPARSFISFERQVFTIVNSQTAYTLDHSVNNENDLRLVINNIVQEPGSGKAYTASGTTLTLSAALTNGTDEMYCVFLGRATATNAPGAGSVNTAAIADNAVTSAKLTYPLTTFSSTGIDDNATSNAMTIESSERVQFTRPRSNTLGDAALEIKPSDTVVGVGFRMENTNNDIVVEKSSPSGSEAEIFRIRSGGGIAIGGTGDANTLSDYEEGTWTPSLDSISSSNASGDYTKIGNVCTAKFKISSDGSGSNINITGFPFTSDSGFEQQGLARETQTGGDLYFIRVAASATTGTLIRYDANNSIGSSDTFEGQITYITNT
jgi:hypothetical protein